MEMTSTNFNGIKKGAATPMAIILPVSPKLFNKGDATARYISSEKGNNTAKITTTTITERSKRSRNSNKCDRKVASFVTASSVCF